MTTIYFGIRLNTIKKHIAAVRNFMKDVKFEINPNEIYDYVKSNIDPKLEYCIDEILTSRILEKYASSNNTNVFIDFLKKTNKTDYPENLYNIMHIKYPDIFGNLNINASNDIKLMKNVESNFMDEIKRCGKEGIILLSELLHKTGIVSNKITMRLIAAKLLQKEKIFNYEITENDVPGCIFILNCQYEFYGSSDKTHKSRIVDDNLYYTYKCVNYDNKKTTKKHSKYLCKLDKILHDVDKIFGEGTGEYYIKIQKTKK